jgi:hypothetical protein
LDGQAGRTNCEDAWGQAKKTATTTRVSPLGDGAGWITAPNSKDPLAGAPASAPRTVSDLHRQLRDAQLATMAKTKQSQLKLRQAQASGLRTHSDQATAAAALIDMFALEGVHTSLSAMLIDEQQGAPQQRTPAPANSSPRSGLPPSALPKPPGFAQGARRHGSKVLAATKAPNVERALRLLELPEDIFSQDIPDIPADLGDLVRATSDIQSKVQGLMSGK